MTASRVLIIIMFILCVLEYFYVKNNKKVVSLVSPIILSLGYIFVDFNDYFKAVLLFFVILIWVIYLVSNLFFVSKN